MKKKYLAVTGVLSCLIFLTGCNKDYPEDKTTEASENLVKSKHVEAIINGLVEKPVVLEIDSEQYKLSENGLFEVDANNIKTLKIAEQPSDSECVIFQGSQSRYKIQVNCVSKEIKLYASATSVGNGWTYAIEGTTRVNYSFENITFVDDNGSLSPIFSENLVGTFYDDKGVGSTYGWVYPAAPIGPNSKAGLDQALFELLTTQLWIRGLSQTYQHETDLIITSEYTIDLDRYYHSAEVIALLAQSIYDASGGAKGDIQYVPYVDGDTTLDTSYRVSFSVWPYIGSEALYMVSVAPLSDMGEKGHFSTPYLSNED
jgi:hypothetical protein